MTTSLRPETLPTDQPAGAASRPTGGDIRLLPPHLLSVLRLMSQGYDNTAIGVELMITRKTVENYFLQICQILGLTAIPGRAKRVLAALGYHYGLHDAGSLVLLGRFMAAVRERRTCAARHLAAEQEFQDVSDALALELGLRVTSLDAPEP